MAAASSGDGSSASPNANSSVGAKQARFKNISITDLEFILPRALFVSLHDNHFYPDRQLVVQDMHVVDMFTNKASKISLAPSRPGMATDMHDSVKDNLPMHARFKDYAPRFFHFFRKQYKVDLDAYRRSVAYADCLTCIANTGASGSLFFRSTDQCFIVKTVQKKEAEFLLELFPAYILALYQSPDTLLPKFFGLYCYQAPNGANIRFTVMHNLVPESQSISEKYDLKGSSYKRTVGPGKSSSKMPTFKDNDFRERYCAKQKHIYLERPIYDALILRLSNDTEILESFRIMDYSLLLAIETPNRQPAETVDRVAKPLEPESFNKPSFYNYKEVLGFKDDSSCGELDGCGIPAYIAQEGAPDKLSAEKVYLYLGIIDILQKYVFKKKLEHHLKAALQENRESGEVSVTHPRKYKERFMEFMAHSVFQPLPAPPQPAQPHRAPGKLTQKHSVHSHPHRPPHNSLAQSAHGYGDPGAARVSTGSGSQARTSRGGSIVQIHHTPSPPLAEPEPEFLRRGFNSASAGDEIDLNQRTSSVGLNSTPAGGAVGSPSSSSSAHVTTVSVSSSSVAAIAVSHRPLETQVPAAE